MHYPFILMIFLIYNKWRGRFMANSKCKHCKIESDNMQKMRRRITIAKKDGHIFLVVNKK